MNLLLLQNRLKVTFENELLLREALTHRSFQNESSNKTGNNERLEFIGDAVLELVSTEYLFYKYPDKPEGELTSFRSALVKTESLAEEGLRIGYGQYILMSNGEESTGGRSRPYILANAFEAIIGAIYIDQGYEAAKIFIERELLYKTDEIVEKRLDIDAKSKLQEVAQEELKITPSYKLVDSIGPDHDKIFKMALLVGDKELTIGEGKSKQEAEQSAAQEALEKWDSLKKDLL